MTRPAPLPSQANSREVFQSRLILFVNHPTPYAAGSGEGSPVAQFGAYVWLHPECRVTRHLPDTTALRAPSDSALGSRSTHRPDHRFQLPPRNGPTFRWKEPRHASMKDASSVFVPTCVTPLCRQCLARFRRCLTVAAHREGCCCVAQPQERQDRPPFVRVEQQRACVSPIRTTGIR